MTVAWLGAIQWDNPAIVGPIAAAITAGLFAIVLKLVKRRKPSDDAPVGGSPTISPQITNAPEIAVEVKPVISPIFKQGLDEKHVGEEISKAVEPLAQTVSAIDKQFEALRDQLTQVQLAPKQPVPDSENPLKVKSVEIYNDGVDAQNRGEAGQAIGHYLAALKLDPDFALLHNNLGVALKDKGDLDGAIEHYNEALRIDPDHVLAHNNFGTALYAKGDLDGAIEHWNEALRIDPDYAIAHYNLGLALKDKRNLDAAIEHWNEALRIDPAFADAHTNLAAALLAKGDIDGAIKHCNEALRLDPDDADAHYNLGCVLARMESAAAAVTALSRAIELDVKNRGIAKSDTDYDPIRNDPAFRKLVYGE